MEIVNGYVCRDCFDAEKAKKGLDPQASKAEQQAKPPGRDAEGPRLDPSRLLDMRA
jgi:hypothetical protein